MAANAPRRRTRRIPLWLFFVYGVLALLIAGALLALSSPEGRSIFTGSRPTPTAAPTSTAFPTAVPTITGVGATPVPTGGGTPAPTVVPGATPTATPGGGAIGIAPSADNPFGLPLWVLQLLFGITAISGIASMARWTVGAVGAIVRLFRR
jgi:hypothetical protein